MKKYENPFSYNSKTVDLSYARLRKKHTNRVKPKPISLGQALKAINVKDFIGSGREVEHEQIEK